MAADQTNPQRNAKGLWYWNPVDAHEAALKQLAAAAGLNQPACFLPVTKPGEKDGRHKIAGAIVPWPASPECHEIVTTNYDYFDRTLPRSAPQMLGIYDFGRCAKAEGDGLTSPPVRRWDVPPQGCVRHA